VPRDQLKKRLLEQKKMSYKQCYDQNCQIELGREMAAEKTLATQIIKIGSSCTVNASLYDLKKAAAETAASVKGKCDEDGLLASIDKVVGELAGGLPAASAGVAVKAAPPPKGPRGLTWVYSEPAGVYFTRTEITVAQYKACMEAGKCKKPHAKTSGCNFGNRGRNNHPVNCLKRKRAVEFCEWQGGRLPTAEEHKKEASDNGDRKYPWGEAKPTCEYVVMKETQYGQTGKGCGKESTWPVCSKPKGNSVSGLCDMSGNVSEWSATLTEREKSKIYGKGSAYGGGWDSIDQSGYTSFGSSYFNPVSQYLASPGIGFRCVREK
jgi:hypothetical protein